MREYLLPGAFLLGGALLGLPLSLMALDRSMPFLFAMLAGAFNGFFGVYFFTLIAMGLFHGEVRGSIKVLLCLTIALIALAIVMPRLG